MPPRTDEEMAKLASALRKQLGLGDQLRPDLMTVINKLKTLYPSRFDYRRIPDHEMPDAEGQWDAERGVLRLRESVFRAMQRGEARARLTVAHEIAHFALKHAGVHNRSTTRSGTQLHSGQLRKEESEATRFAAHFLAPEELAGEDLSPSTLADRFGLSLTASVIRAEEIETFRRRAAGEGRKLPAGVISFLEEARRRGFPVKTDLG